MKTDSGPASTSSSLASNDERTIPAHSRKGQFAFAYAKGDFESVPMADDLRFRGPLHGYVDGARYRRDCADVAATARGISVHHQFFEGDHVHTVYDLDLGLPTGPIASSETLTFADGVLVAADLIIDSTPLRRMAGRR